MKHLQESDCVSSIFYSKTAQKYSLCWLSSSFHLTFFSWTHSLKAFFPITSLKLCCHKRLPLCQIKRSSLSLCWPFNRFLHSECPWIIFFIWLLGHRILLIFFLLYAQFLLPILTYPFFSSIIIVRSSRIQSWSSPFLYLP